MPETDRFLLFTAFATAGVHSLIPDHWLPIVLVGRRERWSLSKVMRVAALSGAFHVMLSFALGVAAYFLGETAARSVGSGIEIGSHVLLVVFGTGYVAYDITLGHGRRAFRDPRHTEGAHMPHLPPSSAAVPWIIAAVVGFNPCVLVAPLLVSAMALGEGPLLLTTLAVFSFTTAGALLVSTAIGHKGAERFHARWLERWGGILSGGLVAVLGIFLLLRHEYF